MKHFLILTTILLAFAAVPAVTHAADISFPYWGPLVTCTGAGQGTLPPCESLCDVLETFQAWIYFGLTIGVLVLVPIMIAIGGIMMMIGGGNENLLKQGRATLTGAIMGLVIILGAFVIINTFIWLVTGITDEGGLEQKWYDVECSIPGGN